MTNVSKNCGGVALGVDIKETWTMNAKLYNLKQGDVLIPVTDVFRDITFYLVLKYDGVEARYVFYKDGVLKFKAVSASDGPHSFFSDQWRLIRKCDQLESDSK